jgi:hypothetical protein
LRERLAFSDHEQAHILGRADLQTQEEAGDGEPSREETIALHEFVQRDEQLKAYRRA